MDPEQKQKARNIENLQRELRRRSLDVLAIFNPLTTPFQTIWEGFIHSVSPQTESLFPRYIAEKWMREFSIYMINEDERIAVAKENEIRKKKGFAALNDGNGTEERSDFARGLGLTTDNEELVMKYYKMVYRGVSKEHGLDMPDPQAPKKADKSPLHEKLLKQLDTEMGIGETPVADDLDEKEDIIKGLEDAK